MSQLRPEAIAVIVLRNYDQIVATKGEAYVFKSTASACISEKIYSCFAVFVKAAVTVGFDPSLRSLFEGVCDVTSAMMQRPEPPHYASKVQTLVELYIEKTCLSPKNDPSYWSKMQINLGSYDLRLFLGDAKRLGYVADATTIQLLIGLFACLKREFDEANWFLSPLQFCVRQMIDEYDERIKTYRKDESALLKRLKASEGIGYALCNDNGAFNLVSNTNALRKYVRELTARVSKDDNVVGWIADAVTFEWKARCMDNEIVKAKTFLEGTSQVQNAQPLFTDPCPLTMKDEAPFD